MQIIKELRQERGLSQQRLAELAGIDKVNLIRIETGRGNPTVETLGKLATALDVEMADLFPKAQTPLFPALPDTAIQEERRAVWNAAVRSARQLRERGHARMEGLLSAWRTSRARGEAQDARRDSLDEMGELLQEAYDAERALFRMLGDPLDLAAVDLEDFEELQAASRFYGELYGMVEGAELHIRTDGAQQQGAPQQGHPESHTVEELKAA